MTPPRKPRRQAAWFRAAEASSVGIEIAVAIAAGAIGGYYLERNVTHWSPWTSLLGMMLGIAAAAHAVVRIARKTQPAAPLDPKPDQEPDDPSQP